MAMHRSSEKEAFWRNVIEVHPASQLTVKEFVINARSRPRRSTLAKREIKKRDAPGLPVPAFVPVTVVEPPAKCRNTELRITRPGGAFIEVFSEGTA